MSTVIINQNDTAGTKLVKWEEEKRILHPHLAAGHARALVREEHPEEWEAHCRGLADVADLAPTLDPGVDVNANMHRLLKSGQARNRAEAFEMTHREMPEKVEGYLAGLRTPATTATREHSAEPHGAGQASDAGMEALRRIDKRMKADPSLSRREARNREFHDDPELERCVNEGRPLPALSSPPPRQSQAALVEQALVQVLQLKRELAQLAGTQERHYRDLSAAERARALPPRVARLAQAGDKIGAPMFFDGSAGG